MKKKKKTWGQLNIFVHQYWTYLPPCDLYDVILPNLGLFWCFLAYFCPKSTCLIDILMFLDTVCILLGIYCKIGVFRCVTSSSCSKHWCQRVLVKMSIKPIIIFSEVNIMYHVLHQNLSITSPKNLFSGPNKRGQLFFLGLLAQPTYLPSVLGQHSGTPLD